MPRTRTIKVGSAKVGPGRPLYLIAEAGVNHNGDVALAEKMIAAAAHAGADAVKFQAFKADLLASRGTPLAPYQKKNVRSARTQRTMLKNLELSRADFERLKAACDAADLEFLASPFDADSLDMLLELSVNAVKVASPELTDLPLLKRIASAKRTALVSTGAATLKEVAEAVATLSADGLKDIALFHCVSAYPAPYQDSNLRALATLEAKFHLPVGFSDHSPGIHIGAAAVAAGAMLLEKHFTLDRSLPGPDHALSLSPSELHSFVTAVRQVEAALGDGVKKPRDVEIAVRDSARKSLVAAVAIAAGQKLRREMLAAKRPGTGVSPRDIRKVVGRRAKCDIPADTVITWDML